MSLKKGLLVPVAQVESRRVVKPLARLWAWVSGARLRSAPHVIATPAGPGAPLRGRSGQEAWAGHPGPRRGLGSPSVTLQTQRPSRGIPNNPLPTTFLWLYNTVFPRVLWHFIKAARRWYCPFSRSEINSSFIASGNARAAVRTFDRFSQLQDLWSILYLHLHQSPTE